MEFRRKALMAVLALGTVVGYAHGFSSIHACRQHHRRALEHHIADICTASAYRVNPPHRGYSPSQAELREQVELQDPMDFREQVNLQDPMNLQDQVGHAETPSGRLAGRHCPHR